MAFVSTSLVNLAIAHAGLLLGIIRGYEHNAIDRWLMRKFQSLRIFKIRKETAEFWTPVMEKLILLISDYQLLFGVAILIAGFWKHCTISVYHFSLVVDLAWFSNTHVSTLIVNVEPS